jgi:Divergent InlB B-repeat domain
MFGTLLGFVLLSACALGGAGSATYSLKISKVGAGVGSVSSEPTGLVCGDSCTTSFTSSTGVTLVAKPDAGSIFFGWSGACTDKNVVCVITLNTDVVVVATFGKAGPVQLPGGGDN